LSSKLLQRVQYDAERVYAILYVYVQRAMCVINVIEMCAECRLTKYDVRNELL